LEARLAWLTEEMAKEKKMQFLLDAQRQGEAMLTFSFCWGALEMLSMWMLLLLMRRRRMLVEVG